MICHFAFFAIELSYKGARAIYIATIMCFEYLRYHSRIEAKKPINKKVKKKTI